MQEVKRFVLGLPSMLRGTLAWARTVELPPCHPALHSVGTSACLPDAVVVRISSTVHLQHLTPNACRSQVHLFEDDAKARDLTLRVRSSSVGDTESELKGRKKALEVSQCPGWNGRKVKPVAWAGASYPCTWDLTTSIQVQSA